MGSWKACSKRNWLLINGNFVKSRYESMYMARFEGFSFNMIGGKCCNTTDLQPVVPMANHQTTTERNIWANNFKANTLSAVQCVPPLKVKESPRKGGDVILKKKKRKKIMHLNVNCVGGGKFPFNPSFDTREACLNCLGEVSWQCNVSSCLGLPKKKKKVFF